MTSKFKTSQAGKDVIQFFEGCARKLPDGNLIAYRPSPNDNPTIGWGCEGYLFPGTSGEIKVVDGLIITQQQADDAFNFFLANVAEPLVNKHFNPETQGEFDALVSWCWNIRHDRLNRGEYSLPVVFNRKPRDFDAIVEWWIKYVNPNTMVEQGLYRRRLSELCLMFGWPWRFATAAVLKRVNGIISERTDPDYIFSLAQEAAMTEDEITADLNNQQLIKMGGAPVPPAPKPAAKPQKAAEPAKVEEPKPEPKPAEKPPEPPPAGPVPKVDPALPPKPMEQSQTHRGLSKAESGRETVVVGGTLTGIGALLPQLQAVTAYIEKFPAKSILYTLVIIGVIIAIVGAWRWFAGRMIAWEGRVRAERTKV